MLTVVRKLPGRGYFKEICTTMLIAAPFLSGCISPDAMKTFPPLAGTEWQAPVAEGCTDLISFRGNGRYDFYSCEWDENGHGLYFIENDTLYLEEKDPEYGQHNTGPNDPETVRFALVYREDRLHWVGRFEKSKNAWVNTGFVFDTAYVLRRSEKRAPPVIKEDRAPIARQQFLFENDTVRQSITIDSLSPGSIRFLYAVENRVLKNVVKQEGVARLKQGDLEIDVDSEGHGFAVQEYIFDEASCYLALRINAEDGSTLSVTSGDCAQESGSFPFSSIGFLKKQ